MMPTEMELRVARALHDHEWGKVQHSFDDGCAEYWVECARAAIRAMREPTETMMVAADEQGASYVWKAMIDAATSEEPEPR